MCERKLISSIWSDQPFTNYVNCQKHVTFCQHFCASVNGPHCDQKCVYVLLISISNNRSSVSFSCFYMHFFLLLHFISFHFLFKYKLQLFQKLNIIMELVLFAWGLVLIWWCKTQKLQ